jgi:hypothetical protein
VGIEETSVCMEKVPSEILARRIRVHAIVSRRILESIDPRLRRHDDGGDGSLWTHTVSSSAQEGTYAWDARVEYVGRTVWLDACAMGKKHSQSFPRESNCGGMDEKGKRNRL